MNEKTMKEKLKIWFGMDVSKDSFDVSVSMTGEEIKDISSMKKVSFNRTEEGVEKFIHWAEAEMMENSQPNGSEFGVVMEATGSYSLTIVSWLLDKCSRCIPSIADPKSVHAYGKSLRIRNKTDKIDAAILAIYGAERNPKPYVPQNKEYSHLRELVRQRRSTVNILTAMKVQAMEPSNVKAVLEERKKNIRSLEKSIVRLEIAIKKHVSENLELKKQVVSLSTIPGIALITAATIIGELGDVRRFSSGKKIAAFVGVSPRNYESGKSVKGRTRMCKEGQGRIRQALYLSALSAIRTNNDLSKFYHRLLLNGKSKMAAIGAVMRKMICIVRRLIVDNSFYQDELLAKKT